MSVFWSILRLFVRQKYCTKGFSVVFIKKIKFKKQLPYLLKKKKTKNRYSIFKPLLLFNNYVQNDFFFSTIDPPLSAKWQEDTVSTVKFKLKI